MHHYFDASLTMTIILCYHSFINQRNPIMNILVDATGDLDRVRQIRSLVGDKLLLYSGNGKYEACFVVTVPS